MRKTTREIMERIESLERLTTYLNYHVNEYQGDRRDIMGRLKAIERAIKDMGGAIEIAQGERSAIVGKEKKFNDFRAWVHKAGYEHGYYSHDGDNITFYPEIGPPIVDSSSIYD